MNSLIEKEKKMIEREIAKSFIKKAYDDETNKLIIMNQEEMCTALEARYSSGPDSDVQYDENGPYHFNNLNIEKIHDIYLTLMERNSFPSRRRQVFPGRSLNKVLEEL